MIWLKRKKHVESSKNTGTSSEVIKKVVTTNNLDDRCLKSKSIPHVGQVHSQGFLPRTNTDRVPKKATRDQACATVKSCSVKEVEIQTKINPFFTMKWKNKIGSQFLHGTKTISDLPHECQVEEANCWLKKRKHLSTLLHKLFNFLKIGQRRQPSSMRMMKTQTNQL